ncbi:MAG TPA: HYR domain-containing protein, partial [Saprospiraceae bacterium]|nr:HYR domain-containing protein [Saprospiraceae bacterium]
ITVDAPTGQTSAVVNWSTPTTTFSCSTGNVTLTQTAGLASGSAFPIGTSTISYQATNNCGDTDNCSFTVTVNEITNPGNYCTADSDFPWQDWITNVSLGTINNNSGKSAYGDFTNLSTNLNKGTNYTLSVSNTFSYLQNYSVYSRAWIDFNNDNTFSASELVLSVDKTNLPNGTTLDIVSQSFTIPNTASTGTTRMRVILSKDTPPTSCGTIAFGEVEDYNINITANAAARAVYFLNGEKQNRTAHLNWVTNEEFTNDYFIVERSADQINFEELSTINSREEFTKETRSYHYIDEAPLAGANYYRIKKVAMDDSFEYSNEQLMNFGEKSFLRVYPNPAANESFIDLSNYLNQKVALSIYNVNGIKQVDYIIEKASNIPFRMDLQNLQNGAYLIYIKVEGRRAQARKLIVSKMY